MGTRYHYGFTVLTTLIAAVSLASGQDVNAEDVKGRLEGAKVAYAMEVEKYKVAVGEVLDKREEAARAKGDKKLVEQIAAERKTFLAGGDPPATAPKQQLVAARAQLDRVYTTTVKNYIRLKMDGMAATIEKERDEFLIISAILLGRKTYLAKLKHFNLRAETGGFSNNGIAPGSGGKAITIKGELAPNSLFLHPPTRGVSQISYNLPGKAAIFRANVGVPKVEDDSRAPVSPLTFEVIGDDKSLWKSDPVTALDEFQKCEIKVEKVKTLTLRVHCPRANAWARATWFDPILIDP